MVVKGISKYYKVEVLNIVNVFFLFIKSLIIKLEMKIMKLSEVPINPVWNQEIKNYTNDKLDYSIIDQIVFKGIFDNNLPSKYAICFGTSRKVEMCARVKKAVELYKKGRIQKVLFTGGKNGISSAKNNQTPEEVNKDNLYISYIINDDLAEAERMKNLAIELGIPTEDVIVDCESNNSNETLQNLIKFIKVKNKDNLTLITSAYHLKRCLAAAKKYVPLDLTYTLVTAETGYFEKENYQQTKLGYEILNFEANRLVHLARENKIADLEIENTVFLECSNDINKIKRKF